MSPRVVLGAVLVAALVRFAVTPTWPCAAVVLGALAVCAWVHVNTRLRRADDVQRLAERAKEADDRAKAAIDACSDLNARLASIERARAFGG